MSEKELYRRIVLWFPSVTNSTYNLLRVNGRGHEK